MIGWLADEGNADGIKGGAELTQEEFRKAKPKGTAIVKATPDDLDRLKDCETVCVFNSVTYPRETIQTLEGKRVIRYWNDLAPHGDADLKRWLLAHAHCVFTSPLHRDRFPWKTTRENHLIPPALNLHRFRAAQNGHERAGAISLGSWENFGKAPHLVEEWAQDNGGVHFYGGGPLAPEDSKLVAYDDVPELLSRYQTFVFLPTAVEPFGRAVVEAWASGCQIVTNRLVGARHWIEHDPDALETAAEQFWALVLS